MLPALADRVSARPKRSLLFALLFVLLAGFFGGPVAGALEESGGFAPADAGSERAVERIEAATGRQAAPGIVLLVATQDGATSPDAQARIAALQERLGKEPGIAETASPVDGSDGGALVAADGRSVLISATLRADADEDAVARRVMERFDAPDVELGGSLIAQTQIGDRVGADLGRAEMLAFPILLVLSLLFFRGRAAWLPLAVGITTVLGTFLALSLVNQAYGLSIFALNLVIGLGLGLAIDYTLFLVTRFREELATDPDHVRPAIGRTMQSAGRTVVFSAATVAVALITLTLFPLGFLKSMGIAGAVVAVVAAIASLVLTPAFFGLWGRKLLITPKRDRAERVGAWYRLSHAVMHRPALVAVATAGAMLLATLPALSANFTPVDASVIPKADSARTVADTLSAQYPGAQNSPVTLAISAPSSDQAGIAAYAAELEGLPGVTSVTAPASLDTTTWSTQLTVRGEPEGSVARSVVEAVRAQNAYPVLVGGGAAEFVDQQAAIGDRLPLALGLLALLTFVVLWLMTGSVVLPLKAIVMNALTVGAALGALKLVYQDGRFEDLLGYTANGGIEPTDFLVAAALVFALSTDYGVFLLGRIKEARDAGVDEREAVALGLERTGAVVTAAAILLAVAIGAFATSSISFIQQIGVATAVGVLIDAFVVRSLLVPALMALLGKWNWWAPMGLRRFHDRIGGAALHGPAAPQDAVATATATATPTAAR